MKKTSLLNTPRLAAAALAALTLICVTTLRADTGLTNMFAMPLQIKGTIGFTDCNNSPGPQVTLEGELVLGGFTADLIFKNNVKGTHTTVVEFTTNAVLVTPGDVITLPKQPPLGGVGGNPFIWIQFLDGNSNALTDEIFIGRCVQGPLVIDPTILAQVISELNVSVAGCANHPGPTITVSGALVFSSGLKARFIFRNNDNPVGGPHVAVRTFDVTLLAPGAFIQIPKQPVLGGSGGNPLIFIQLRQGNGAPIGNEVFI